MKKFLKVILSIILFLFVIKIDAYELTYSEWSEEYPSEYDEKFIQSEERYLWSKEEFVNEKYLPKDEFGSRVVDYKDFKYSDEITTTTKVEEKEDRIINEKKVEYTDKDICGFTIEKVNNNDKVIISEIEFLEKESLIRFDISNIEEYKYLFDGYYNNYESLNELDHIKIKLNSKINLDDILFKIYYKSDNNENTIKVSYISCDDYQLYEGIYKTDAKKIQVLKDDLKENDKNVTYYTYKDKLFKTYEVKKEVTKEYYKQLDGYEKIQDSKKMFYRYITNEFVYVLYGDVILKNPKECGKNFCKIVYVTKKEIPKEEKEEKKEEPKNENPQTIDPAIYYFVILVVSVVSLFIIFREKIFLVLSNQFKKKN